MFKRGLQIFQAKCFFAKLCGVRLAEAERDAKQGAKGKDVPTHSSSSASGSSATLRNASEGLDAQDASCVKTFVCAAKRRGIATRRPLSQRKKRWPVNTDRHRFTNDGMRA